MKKVQKQLKKYSAPTMIDLGSAVKLTRGGGMNGGDLHGSREPRILPFGDNTKKD
ncbi:lasso RiPP family leader peptide-containing protein [Ornithinibacillus californiensis]|uniref:lasso RiPP family leader peptide-containing protein n=1 Tax=Ornithinibacillus californiensis TaxID=161536 RepID=UPI001F450CB0|nr:lasso RiPP family leader peptide-containing protein [Ornithinibacillus californiensis]